VERAIGARVLTRLHFCIQYFIDLLVKESSRVKVDVKDSLRHTYHQITGEMNGLIYRAATEELPTRGEITNLQIQIVFEGFYISAIDRIEALCGVLQVFKRTKEPIAYCPGFGILWIISSSRILSLQPVDPIIVELFVILEGRRRVGEKSMTRSWCLSSNI
jgi:hypothetical protein